MYKTILLIIFVFAASPVAAKDRLSGKWRSSLELSRNFYQQHAILKPAQREFIEQVFGELEVEYKGGKVVTRSQSKKIAINGKQFYFHGTNDESSYRVIFESDNKVVIKTHENGHWVASTLVFVSNDVYWEYVGEGEYGSDLNIREYFVRVK
jgi:hypothetical protein